MDAANQIEDRGFPRPVGADQSYDLSRRNRHVQIFDRCQAAEIFGDSLQCQ